MDWIQMSVREKTLRGDPLSLFRFAIIPLENQKRKIEKKEGIIKAFKNPTGNFRYRTHLGQRRKRGRDIRFQM